MVAVSEMMDMSVILATIEYDGKLSVAAYVILAAMFVIIVGGLLWCFYRAMTAVGKDSGEQHPDEV